MSTEISLKKLIQGEEKLSDSEIVSIMDSKWYLRMIVPLSEKEITDISQEKMEFYDDKNVILVMKTPMEEQDIRVQLGCMTAEIVYMAMGIAHYSWLESLITFGVSLILAVILYSRLTNSFGGGIKGLIMSGLYLGRYLAVLLVILYLLCVFAYIMKKLSKKTAEYTVPGELTVSIMPFLIIAAGLTVGIQYLRMLRVKEYTGRFAPSAGELHQKMPSFVRIAEPSLVQRMNLYEI